MKFQLYSPDAVAIVARETCHGSQDEHKELDYTANRTVEEPSCEKPDVEFMKSYGRYNRLVVRELSHLSDTEFHETFTPFEVPKRM